VKLVLDIGKDRLETGAVNNPVGTGDSERGRIGENEDVSCISGLALSIGHRRGQNPVSETLCFKYKQDGF
jgi:hypothetical protein